jgi:distribution and morphology protein 31
LQSGADKGPLSWIVSGRADLVADIRFPRGPEDDIDLHTILGDIVDNLDEALRTSGTSTASNEVAAERIPGQRQLSKGQPLEAPPISLRSMLGIDADQDKKDKNRVVCMRLDIRFRDVKAVVPLFPDDLSSVNNALVRPIVAFLNANKTLIPIRCHVDIDLGEFDGSWTTYDIGLLDAIAEQVYSALANHVQESNAKRARTVGLWSLQKSAAAILLALKENLEHL